MFKYMLKLILGDISPFVLPCLSPKSIVQDENSLTLNAQFCIFEKIFVHKGPNEKHLLLMIFSLSVLVYVTL